LLDYDLADLPIPSLILPSLFAVCEGRFTIGIALDHQHLPAGRDEVLPRDLDSAANGFSDFFAIVPILRTPKYVLGYSYIEVTRMVGT
jgi:hypothetical protein